MAWDDCDLRTLLYVIAHEDVEEREQWDTDLIVSIIVKATEEMAKNSTDAEGYAIDLNEALERIHFANVQIERRANQ